MRARDFVIGVIATVLAILAAGIIVRWSWSAWDWFIDVLIKRGFPPNIEYFLGFVLVITAVWLGVVELRKMGKS